MPFSLSKLIYTYDVCVCVCIMNIMNNWYSFGIASNQHLPLSSSSKIYYTGKIGILLRVPSRHQPTQHLTYSLGLVAAPRLLLRRLPKLIPPLSLLLLLNLLSKRKRVVLQQLVNHQMAVPLLLLQLHQNMIVMKPLAMIRHLQQPLLLPTGKRGRMMRRRAMRVNLKSPKIY